MNNGLIYRLSVYSGRLQEANLPIIITPFINMSLYLRLAPLVELGLIYRAASDVGLVEFIVDTVDGEHAVAQQNLLNLGPAYEATAGCNREANASLIDMYI